VRRTPIALDINLNGAVVAPFAQQHQEHDKHDDCRDGRPDQGQPIHCHT
jgi:hypothetical protein